MSLNEVVKGSILNGVCGREVDFETFCKEPYDDTAKMRG